MDGSVQRREETEEAFVGRGDGLSGSSDVFTLLQSLLCLYCAVR